MTQFGYGRRTCQGQTVTEADLLVGIGSIAWLFNISKDVQAQTMLKNEPELPPTPVSPVSEAFDLSSDEKSVRDEESLQKTRKLMINKKASISYEVLISGLSAHSNECDEDEYAAKIPCAFPLPTQQELKEQYCAEFRKRQKAEEEKTNEPDPTLIYSTLLIAKPLPFQFSLTVRERSRAEKVMGDFVQKKAEGEFQPSREYWGPNQGTGKELGWGKV